MFQAFPPRHSGESRLEVTENNVSIEYDTKSYEEVMFYHNVVRRVHYRYDKITEDDKGLLEPSLLLDYDSMWISVCFKKYLEWLKRFYRPELSTNDKNLKNFTDMTLKNLSNLVKHTEISRF